MSSLTFSIIAVFVVGYLFIALESVTKVNKAAVALLMFVLCWTLFMIDPGSYISNAVGSNVAQAVSEVIEKHLGSTSTTLFFLMGAMTIVEIVDQNGGFSFVPRGTEAESKRAFFWRIGFLSFFLSATFANYTDTI